MQQPRDRSTAIGTVSAFARPVAMPAISRSKFPPRTIRTHEPGCYCYDKAGGCGAQFVPRIAEITEQETGRVPNPDTADQVNTILKMAEKRALIAATLIAVNASDYFTQDIEDLPGFGEIVETQVRIVASPPTGTDPEPPSDAEFRKLTRTTEERPAAQPSQPTVGKDSPRTTPFESTDPKPPPSQPNSPPIAPSQALLTWEHSRQHSGKPAQ